MSPFYLQLSLSFKQNQSCLAPWEKYTEIEINNLLINIKKNIIYELGYIKNMNELHQNQNGERRMEVRSRPPWIRYIRISFTSGHTKSELKQGASDGSPVASSVNSLYKDIIKNILLGR